MSRLKLGCSWAWLGRASLALVIGLGSIHGAAADASDQTVAVEDAQTSNADSSGATEPEQQVGLAASFSSKLKIHGYLTQGYADAKFATGGFVAPPALDERLLGIPEDGTTDYRTMAIQFRYDHNDKNTFIIQFSSRGLGNSPISDVEDEIKLNWASYQYRFTDQTSVKIGRVAIAFGIFNEVRYVGTVLPFYRPSFGFYREGAFTSETIDGVVLSHRFAPQSDWGLDVDVYSGGWDLVEDEPTAPAGQQTAIARAEDAIGVQAWLNTPLSGLRLGAGGRKYEVRGGLEGFFRLPGQGTDFDDWFLSLDGVFERFVVRAEYRELSGVRQNPMFRGDVVIIPYYGQVGVHFTDKIRLYLQAEFVDTKLTSPQLAREIDTDFRRDNGIAFNYLFTPSLVFKAEYHEYEGEQFRFVPVFTPQGLRLDHLKATADDGHYYIVSLSASF